MSISPTNRATLKRPKLSVAEKRNTKRYETVLKKLSELAQRDDFAEFIQKAINSSNIITHSAKLHNARTLGHGAGAFAIGEVNDGYIHSMSVQAKPDVAGDVDFDIVGNAAYGKVYAVACEIMRSQQMRTLVTSPKEIEVLDCLEKIVSAKINAIKNAGLSDQIPSMLPTTAHMHADETRVFTPMMSSLMLMRYGTAKAMHGENTPYVVRKADVLYGTTSASNQNTTTLPNGSRAFTIVHATTMGYHRNSADETKLFSVMKNGLVASLSRLHDGLTSDAQKLLKTFSVKVDGADKVAATRDRSIKGNTVMGVARRVVASIERLVKSNQVDDRVLRRVDRSNEVVGNKISIDEVKVINFLAGGVASDKQLEQCSSRIAAKLLVAAKNESAQRSFNPSQFQAYQLSEAIFEAILETRK